MPESTLAPDGAVILTRLQRLRLKPPPRAQSAVGVVLGQGWELRLAAMIARLSGVVTTIAATASARVYFLRSFL